MINGPGATYAAPPAALKVQMVATNAPEPAAQVAPAVYAPVAETILSSRYEVPPIDALAILPRIVYPLPAVQELFEPELSVPLPISNSSACVVVPVAPDSGVALVPVPTADLSNDDEVAIPLYSVAFSVENDAAGVVIVIVCDAPPTMFSMYDVLIESLPLACAPCGSVRTVPACECVIVYVAGFEFDDVITTRLPAVDVRPASVPPVALVNVADVQLPTQAIATSRRHDGHRAADGSSSDENGSAQLSPNTSRHRTNNELTGVSSIATN